MPPSGFLERLADVPMLARLVFWHGWNRWWSRDLPLTESQANLARAFCVTARGIRGAEKALEDAGLISIERFGNRREVRFLGGTAIPPTRNDGSAYESSEPGTTVPPRRNSRATKEEQPCRQGGTTVPLTPKDTEETPRDAEEEARACAREPAWLKRGRRMLPEDLKPIREAWERWLQHLRQRKKPTDGALRAQIEKLRQVPTDRRGELLDDCVAANAQGIPAWVVEKFSGENCRHRGETSASGRLAADLRRKGAL